MDMTVFDTRRSARTNPSLIVLMVVVLVLALFVAWELASEVTFTSTVTQRILPGEVVEQLGLADSPTAPITTTGR